MTKNKRFFKSKEQKKKEREQRTPFEELLSWIKTIVGAVVVVMIINGLLVASFVVPTQSMENEVMAGDFLFVNKFIYGPTTPQVIPFINQELPFIKFPGIKDPEKRDVIVFIYPGDRDLIEPLNFQYYLKRCIAAAGDVLEIKNERVYVNGIKQPLPEHVNFDPINSANRPTAFPIGNNWTHDNYGPLKIPAKGDKIELTRDNIQRWRIFIMREGHEVTYDRNDVYIDETKTGSYTVERNYCFAMGDNRRNSEDSRSWGFVPYENVVGTPIVVYWSWDPNIPLSNIFDKFGSLKVNRIGTLID